MPADRANPADTAARECECAHCTLPVPAALVRLGVSGDPEARQFCCAGCRTAFELIHACGLERYYGLLRAAGTGVDPVQSEATTPAGDPGFTEQQVATRLSESFQSGEGAASVGGRGDRWSTMDDAAYLRVHAAETVSGLRRAELTLERVHCVACVWLVERLPRLVEGVIESRLDLRRRTATVVFDPARAPLSRIARTLDALGYTPHPAKQVSARALRRTEDRRHLVAVGIAGFLMMNVMLLAFALYPGEFEQIAPEYRALFRVVSAVLGLASIFGPGLVFFRSAFAALRARAINLDAPIALALLVGGVSGSVNVAMDTGEIYFDSLSMLVFLLLVGRFVQSRQQRFAADSMELLLSIVPTTATLVQASSAAAGGTDTPGATGRDQMAAGRGESLREVAIETLREGDIVQVRAGQSVPVDGVVCGGASAVDQALLTGESAPVEVMPGDRVFAGTVNLSGLLRVRAAATGESTAAARVMRLVEEAGTRRPPILRFIDSIAPRFVLVLAAVAVATLVAWAALGRLEHGIDAAIALLIVTCPCALALAAPLVVAVAVGRGARRGILIKGGDALEALAAPGVLLLDKTGTVTQGQLRITEFAGDKAALEMAEALEAFSSHPIARAIRLGIRGETPIWPDDREAGSAEGEREEPEVRDVRQTTGAGIQGLVDGRQVMVGSVGFVSGGGAVMRGLYPTLCDAWAAAGHTPVLIAVDGVVEAAVAIGDPIRPEARLLIDSLKRRGWEVGLLSGDHAVTVAAVGRALGLDAGDCHGNASPEDKLRVVRELRERAAREGPDGEATRARAGKERRSRATPVVMVGDGVNDAAALAAASVGVAVHGGAEASLAAADVYLNAPGLSPIADLFDAGRHTLRSIRATLWASLAYNALAGSLAITGVIHPLVAAILMPLSGLTMLAIALRCRAFVVPATLCPGSWSADTRVSAIDEAAALPVAGPLGASPVG